MEYKIIWFDFEEISLFLKDWNVLEESDLNVILFKLLLEVKGVKKFC